MRTIPTPLPPFAIPHLVLLAAAAGLALCGARQCLGADAVIDDCGYATDAAAQAVWQPMRGSAEVLAATLDGAKALRLPCRFAGKQIERASWDRRVKLDLAQSRGVQFQLLCRNASPVSYFAIYFQSGEGWYQSSFYPDLLTGWNTIEIDRADMKPEGKPGGWDKIRTIRISAWRGKDVDTEFYLRGLRQVAASPPPGPRQLAEAAIAQIGKVASFNDYEEATNQISRLAPQDARVSKALGAADAARGAAAGLLAEQKFPEARDQAATAKADLVKAYCLAQRPLSGEFRAFWCHNAFGVQGLTWDEAIRRLADNGFTAILPNMLWGGAAFYDSKVLPVAAQAAERGDQIRECVAACRKYGLQVHVWKVNWNLGRAAPKDFVERMRREGRLQASAAGKEEPWLCPSHPANQQLEIAAMVEVARNYDVDGIHFDYIRYPDADHCFCPGCKERFQGQCGVTVHRWPEDVLAEGPLRQQWLDWRRSNITAVVKAVSEQARAAKPRIKLSAAVFRYWNTDRDAVGQDWKVWCDKGYLDFVCPMDYTSSNSRFDSMVAEQVAWAGRTPCYPGLGVSASSSQFGPDRAVEQINITRRYQTHGFVIFNYGLRESTTLLPMLGMGITQKQ
ncbi:MAG TPA: family 10 glycosylhydrolase [Candidatus Acidoferrum sp.]|nr:family 10 glycosylhydrolase [Candidatus Acidoferrum sp.]